MFQRTKMTAAVSQELIDELTDHGRRDLSQLRMDELVQPNGLRVDPSVAKSLS